MDQVIISLIFKSVCRGRVHCSAFRKPTFLVIWETICILKKSKVVAMVPTSSNSADLGQPTLASSGLCQIAVLRDRPLELNSLIKLLCIHMFVQLSCVANSGRF